MKTLTVSSDARGVVTVELARPEKGNAMSRCMIDELAMTGKQLGAESGVRVIILTGQGRQFCAGADLAWMKEQFSSNRAQRVKEANRLAEMLRIWNELPRPVVIKVNGGAFGGGLGLIAVGDIACAAAHAKFCFSETRLGLIPATISPYVISRIGPSAARDVFLSARVFGTGFACRSGLIAEAVAAEDLHDLVEERVGMLLSAAPEATAAAKALIRTMAGLTFEQQRTHSVSALARRWESEEAHEGVSAFLEKRKPDWPLA